MGNVTGDKSRGLYRKYDVRRTDGRDAPGEKHHGCRYFVLDLDHDPHARTAIRAYADSCEVDGFGALATDLRSEAWARIEAPVPDADHPQRTPHNGISS